MSTFWPKIRGDLRAHRVQFAWLLLLLTLGLAGVLTAWNTRLILQREIARSYASAAAPDLYLRTGPVRAEQLQAVRAHPAVAGADAIRLGQARVAGPRGEWFQLQFTVRADFAAQQVGLVHRHGGGWADAERGLYLEQSCLVLLGVAPGEPVRVRAPGGRIVQVSVAGTVHDPAVAPGAQEQAVYAYVTPAVAALFGQDAALDRIAVRLGERRSLWETEVLRELRAAAALPGGEEPRADVLSRQHPHALLMNALLQVLGILAVLAFACGAALAGYAASLWLKREGRQIGILKSIGATSEQLARQYLGLAVPILLAALALGFPLAGWLGELLLRQQEVQLNIDLAERGVPWLVLAGEAVVALLIPLAALAWPIARAARQTVSEALRDPGIAAPAAAVSGWRSRLAVPGSREWTLPVRNVLRRPWRLALTLGTLTLGGALYLASSIVFASLMSVVDASLERLGYDLRVNLRQPVEIAQLQRLAAGWKEADAAEVWRRSGVRAGRLDGRKVESAHGERGQLLAHGADSPLQRLPATRGRWPRAEEADAVLIGRPARTALGVEIGDRIWLEPTDRPRREMRVVGEFEEFGGPAFYAVGAAAEALLGPPERSTVLLVRARPGRLAAALEEVELACLEARLDVAGIETRRMRREAMAEHFLGVVGICNVVAGAVALFGGMSLVAFGCLGVLERGREIGVLRALGATTGRVARLFLAESAVVVLCAAAAAVAGGIGLGRGLNHLIETRAFLLTVPLRVEGASLALLALGLLVVLLAVWAALTRLVRATVREALNYE